MADKKQRKERITFTLKKDILLLRGALGYNPWQLGDVLWTEVANDMRDELKEEFTIISLKRRVDLLIDKYSKKQLQYSSGTEEELTERGALLEAIIALKEEEKAAINSEITPEDDTVGEKEPVEQQTNTKNVSKERKLERLAADKERATYVDEAAAPSGSRGKLQRLSVEEEVMMERHKHDMAMEKEKIEIEKLRVQSEQSREEQRLNLEQQREERLKEESKRRDEIAKSQMDIQVTMMDLMRKYLEK